MLLYEAYALFFQQRKAPLERDRADARALFLGMAVIMVLGLLSRALH